MLTPKRSFGALLALLGLGVLVAVTLARQPAEAQQAGRWGPRSGAAGKGGSKPADADAGAPSSRPAPMEPARVAQTTVGPSLAALAYGEPILGRQPGGRVLFTYDDGPDVSTTPRVLDLLEREGLHAVFFVNGCRFDRRSSFSQANRALLQKVRQKGHTIGSHTYNHANLSMIDPGTQAREILKNEDAIERAVGERPYLFRPPYGAITPTMWDLLTKRGYTFMRWSIDPADLTLADRKQIADRVTRALRRLGGGVVILHDINPAAAGATQLILAWMRKESCDRLARGQVPFEIVGPEAFFRPRAPDAPAWGTPVPRRSARPGSEPAAATPARLPAPVASPGRPSSRLRLDRCEPPAAAMRGL